MNKGLSSHMIVGDVAPQTLGLLAVMIQRAEINYTRQMTQTFDYSVCTRKQSRNCIDGSSRAIDFVSYCRMVSDPLFAARSVKDKWNIKTGSTCWLTDTPR